MLTVPYAMEANKAKRVDLPWAAAPTATQRTTTTRNQWLYASGMEVTVPEDGIYMIMSTGRMWNVDPSGWEWGKYRIYNTSRNIAHGVAFIGHNETGSGATGNGDNTGAVNHVERLYQGEKLRMEFFFNSNSSTGQTIYYGGNADGESTLVILKIAD